MQRAQALCQVKNLLLLGVYLSISQRLAEICRFSALEDDQLMLGTGGSPRAALERAAPNSARQRRLKEC